jgi:hypothetical protein
MCYFLAVGRVARRLAAAAVGARGLSELHKDASYFAVDVCDIADGSGTPSLPCQAEDHPRASPCARRRHLCRQCYRGMLNARMLYCF